MVNEQFNVPLPDTIYSNVNDIQTEVHTQDGQDFWNCNTGHSFSNKVQNSFWKFMHTVRCFNSL